MKNLMLAVVLSTQLAIILGTAPLVSLKCWVFDSSCLTSQFRAFTPAITKGTIGLGIEKLDPMIIDTLNIDTGILKVLMTNLHVEGLKDAVIDSVSIDMVSKLAQVVYHADISVKSQYVSKGFLFSLPFIGEGDMFLNMENVQVKMIMPFDIIKDENGRDTMNLKGFQYSYDVRKGAQYQLGNLYYGDKVASDAMHFLINSNWKLLSIEYGSYLFDAMNPRIFNAIRTYMLSQPIGDVVDLSTVFQK